MGKMRYSKQPQQSHGAIDQPVHRRRRKGEARHRGKKGPRYTPVSRRQDRPDAIAWFKKAGYLNDQRLAIQQSR